MKKIMLLIILGIVFFWFYTKTNLPHADYEVFIEYHGRTVAPNIVSMVYKNEDKNFSKEIIDGIKKSHRVLCPYRQKRYMNEGFFRIYLKRENEELVFEANTDLYIFSVEKQCELNYPIVKSIYEYLGQLYLKKVLELDHKR